MKKQKKVAGYVNCCPVCHCEIDTSRYFNDKAEIGKDLVDIACVECKSELRVYKGRGKKGVVIELVDVVAGSENVLGVDRIVRMNPNGDKEPGLKVVKNTLVYKPKETM